MRVAARFLRDVARFIGDSIIIAIGIYLALVALSCGLESRGI